MKTPDQLANPDDQVPSAETEDPDDQVPSAETEDPDRIQAAVAAAALNFARTPLVKVAHVGPAGATEWTTPDPTTQLCARDNTGENID